MKRRWWILKCVAVAAGSVGLASAYPPFDQSSNVWFALVPLLWLIRTSSPRTAAKWGLLFGMLFWPITLSWLPAIIPNGGPAVLVFAGMIVLSLYCSFFIAAFAYLSATIWSRARGAARIVVVCVCDPLLWAFLEWVRGTLFSGFAWNFLAVSQVSNLPVVQIASIAGVYGVSMVLMLVNGALTGMLSRMAGSFVQRLPINLQGCGQEHLTKTGIRFLPSLESAIPMALAVFVWLWGSSELRGGGEKAKEVVRAAVIQPNVPCVFLHGSNMVAMLEERIVGQTAMAALAKPDVVVWPECAIIEPLPDGKFANHLVRLGVERCNGAVLLAGANEEERREDGTRWYNSVMAFDENGAQLGVYRKRHLVPFGEYIPLDKTITFLQRFSPTGVSCTAGEHPLPIALPKRKGVKFGVLICFEDTIPCLSRSTVRAGANVLVLATNDAWFSGSCEATQHHRQAIFRAIENRVPMIRCANSGVSCFVDAFGRVKKLEADGKESDFHGFLIGEVVPGVGSVYTQLGDVPLISAGSLIVLLALFFRFHRRGFFSRKAA